MGLRFWGSYDTIQILLAAYSGKMCFAQSHFPQKSRFFLPSSFDPHGTGERVRGGLCQQSCVSAGGPCRPPLCHSLLFVNAWPAKPPCGAVSCHGPKNNSQQNSGPYTTQMCTVHSLVNKRFYQVWEQRSWIFGRDWWRWCDKIAEGVLLVW